MTLRRPHGDLRLAQLTELTGLSALVIRAWERRYGFPAPVRSAGGQRRYSRAQAEALLRASLLVRSGFRAREAIARARDEIPGPAATSSDLTVGSLADLLVAGDPARAFDRLRGLENMLGFETTLFERVLPALRQIGHGWETGALTVAQEHTATGIAISWLGSVRAARRGGDPGAPLVLVATPPGEHHAVSVWALEVLLHARGLNALALGADVPITALAAEAESRRPAAIVLGISRGEVLPMLAEVVEGLSSVEPRPRLLAGGPGVTGPLPAGMEALPPGLLEAADWIARELVGPPLTPPLDPAPAPLPPGG